VGRWKYSRCTFSCSSLSMLLWWGFCTLRTTSCFYVRAGSFFPMILSWSLLYLVLSRCLVRILLFLPCSCVEISWLACRIFLQSVVLGPTTMCIRELMRGWCLLSWVLRWLVIVHFIFSSPVLLQLPASSIPCQRAFHCPFHVRRCSSNVCWWNLSCLLIS